MIEKSGEYLPTAQVRAMLGGLSKSRITAIARANNWQCREVYSGRRFPAKEYLAADVQRELERRTEPGE